MWGNEALDVAGTHSSGSGHPAVYRGGGKSTDPVLASKNRRSKHPAEAGCISRIEPPERLVSLARGGCAHVDGKSLVAPAQRSQKPSLKRR